MLKSEIALKLALAMLDKGYYSPAAECTNVDFGKTIADLYNAILYNLSLEE